MHKLLIPYLFLILMGCQGPSVEKSGKDVFTQDVDLFWEAYDQVTSEKDSTRQVALFDSIYISRGSIGLEKMIEAREYSAEEYVNLINKYPSYWASIRSNTLKAKEVSQELQVGIQKLKDIYPELKPAKIYFTVGAMRSNGTTRDSLVLIGSELAMADSSTDISEFEGRSREWLANFFSQNPIEKLVLLNVHEYVHTQQNPIPDRLLYQVLYEGIAEFVSTKAMGIPSSVPAIKFGKNHPEVKQKFEEEMFLERTYEWMWSNAPNDFGVRDLGYYLGYAMAERHYQKSEDKDLAIKQLVEIDYGERAAVDSLIDGTGFFSRPISKLREEFEKKRPEVLGIAPFKNGQQDVSPATDRISILFSSPMAHRRNFDYGPLGEEAVVRFREEVGYSEGDRRYTFLIEPLLPEKRYQITIGRGFQDKEGMPLKPFLIDFQTGKE